MTKEEAGRYETPAVILVEPQLGENIGAAARAMANFGLGDLRLVAPREPWPNEKARASASRADFVIEAARVFPRLEDAAADLHFLAATTARPRELIKPVMTPESAAREMRRRMASGERCGVLFGRERWGLENDHVALADVIVMAPVNPNFASLNLAQAVLLVGYEWLKSQDAATLGRHTALDGQEGEGLALRGGRPANKEEMLGLLEHLERELDAAGFLHPPEKRPVMVRNIRTLFTRMGPTEQEVRTLRGVIASLARSRLSRPK